MSNASQVKLILSWIVGDMSTAKQAYGDELRITDDFLVPKIPDSLRDRQVKQNLLKVNFEQATCPVLFVSSALM